MIPTEIWKSWEFDDILLRHCNVIYNQNTIDRWTKKDDLGLAKKYRGIILKSIAAKIYNAILRNCVEPKIEKILKNQNGFWRNLSNSTTCTCKNLEATILFVDLSKTFESIHRGIWSKYYSPTDYPNQRYIKTRK